MFSNPVMIAIGVLLVTSSIAVYFLLIREPSSSKNVKVKIPLEKLSRLWVDENSTIDVLPPVASRTTPQFFTKEIGEFYRTTLAPYVETALYSATIGTALDAIIKILLILDQEGDCPSVVEAKGDPEYEDHASFFDLLKKIPLRVHSLNVAQESVNILNSSGYREPELLLGRVLVVALAHDLGKIPKFRQGQAGYALGNHPNVSAAVAEPFLAEVPGKEELLAAIRDHHHTGSTNQMVAIVREADRKAREREIAMVTGRAIVDAKALSWLNPKDLLAEIENSINVINPADGSFDAFVHKDIVYVQPSFISKTIVAMAEKNDVMLQAKTDFKALSATVVHTHFKDLMAAEIIDGYAARRCEIKFKDKPDKPKKVVFTPFKPEAFQTPLEELEKRKNPEIINIESVRILPIKQAGD